MTDRTLSASDLVENPNARLAICLVLDTSGSMRGAPINELNQGLVLFLGAIQADDIATHCAEIAVVTFGESPRVRLSFEPVEKQKPPLLAARGETIMGAGVNLALDLLEKRKHEYQEAGVDYFQPWMVLMTDGCPGDAIDQAVSRTVGLVQERKLNDVSNRHWAQRKPSDSQQILAKEGSH